jgi:hypothetical protein
MSRRNLAALARDRGDHQEAGRLWAEVLAECPGDREAIAMLGGREDRSESIPCSERKEKE